ncbi:tetratricopeptide repeat protein [Sedimenticola sp.]|uniref:tetratricopeptide repeat protein n=1 Tax=Sedimenticola sp. TaxID=1940285 RepID=UPI00258FEF75|nr:tetratricopeptide repeat protein [Sedimenticola sp.]MCW8904100.1 tetratricopeptide repeat protein [Sedimenticola sp.]
MSLINQMLRDLDRREAAEGPRQVVTPAPVSPATVRGRGRRPALWTLSVIAALLGTIYFQPLMGWIVATVSEDPGAADDRQADERAAMAVIQKTAPSVAMEPADQPVITNSTTTPADEPITRPSPDGLKTTEVLPEALEDTPTAADEPADTGVDMPESTPLDIQPSREIFPERIADKTVRRPTEARTVVESALSADTALAARPDERSAPVVKEAIVKPNGIKPVSVPVEQPLVRVQKVAPKTVRESAANVYATALTHLEEGHLREAEAALRHCLTLDRAHTEARRLLVMLLLKDGERKEAAALLDAGLNIVPDAISLGALRARLLIEDGDLSRAVRLLEQQRSVAGDEIELLSLLGSAYQQTRQFPDAIGIYRRIIEQQPDNARAVAGLAIALDATGDHGEALSVYREALAFDALPAEVSEYARKRVSALSVER